jgi:hypothetical protein
MCLRAKRKHMRSPKPTLSEAEGDLLSLHATTGPGKAFPSQQAALQPDR